MKRTYPIITTAKSRVLLRQPVESDIPTIYKLVRDPLVIRHTFVSYPYRRRNAVQLITLAAREFKNKTSYIFVITDKESGEVIGATGLHQVDPVHKRAELGYWMGKSYRGKGFATEAATLLIEFGFRKLKLERIYAYAMTINPASQRVLKKCGFKDEGLLRRHIYRQRRWRDLFVYAILKNEWKR